MKNLDLHVHTMYSDGSITIREAIKIAKEKYIDFLAITDHYTSSWKKSLMDTINLSNFDQYVAEIKKERRRANFNCLIGIEIDMDSSWDDVQRIPFEMFEIILFEYVESISTLRNVANLIQELDLKSIFALAHNFYIKIAKIDEFCKILVENNIYFELNSRYLNITDNELIKKLKILKDEGVKFTIGSDAHTGDRIGDTAKSFSILEKINGFEYLIDLSQTNFSL